MTFIRACRHITNYTAGHETRTRKLGAERLKFPDNHIEADNRLSWMLGKLGKKYGKKAFYVHLIRNKEATVRSFEGRWHYKNSIIRAYNQGILMRRETGGEEFCEDYYHTVNDNIEYFLRDKEKKMVIRLRNIREDFVHFWEAIGAEGDLEAALEEFEVRHNQSQPRSWLERITFWKN